MAIGSYEQCLRNSLATLPPAMVPQLADVLIGHLLKPPQVHERTPDVLRYRLADRLNLLLKKTPLHGTIKRALSRERRS